MTAVGVLAAPAFALPATQPAATELELVRERPAAQPILDKPLNPFSSGRDRSVGKFFERVKNMHIGGSLSLNWRNVGPKQPGFETQIQDEVFLADMYFGVDGPFFEGIPVAMELHIPTGSQGRPQLNQLYFAYDRVRRFRFQFGKFLAPFGRYNELYKPDTYLAVTRPLLYASADSLDLVVRPNSPRPPLSFGYTDIGVRVSYYPPSQLPIVPTEATLFVVNGFGESANRQRTFPNPENLGIQNIPTNGLSPDFGHENNNLADNNNPKSVGGRMVFGVGETRVAWPFPEESADIDGVTVGLSGMGGEYDLEGQLNYQVYGLDFALAYGGFDFSGEYLWSTNDFLTPLSLAPDTLAAPIQQVEEFEVIHGFFLQGSFPILRKPPLGERLTGILVFNQMYRRGPQLDFLLNYNDGAKTWPSLTALNPAAPRVTRTITKYTGALNWQVSDYFFLKFDYSYWVMGQSTIRSATSLGLVDIYQGALSMVMSF